MAHSVELLFDGGTDAAIRSLWRQLADAGLPSQLHITAPTNRPHVTVLAAQRISGDVDEQLAALAPALPLDCQVGAPVIFTGPRCTLARLVVPSAELLDFHDQVYRLCLPQLGDSPFGHCRPGHWTPHATLARRLTAAQVGAALALPDDGPGAELPARLVGLRRWDGDNRVDHLLIGGAD